jgi:hypothetical protein
MIQAWKLQRVNSEVKSKLSRLRMCLFRGVKGDKQTKRFGNSIKRKDKKPVISQTPRSIAYSKQVIPMQKNAGLYSLYVR